jgi:hypothetical protein
LDIDEIRRLSGKLIADAVHPIGHRLIWFDGVFAADQKSTKSQCSPTCGVGVWLPCPRREGAFSNILSGPLALP